MKNYYFIKIKPNLYKMFNNFLKPKNPKRFAKLIVYLNGSGSGSGFSFIHCKIWVPIKVLVLRFSSGTDYRTGAFD